MTALLLSEQAAEDIERLADFLLETLPYEAAGTGALILDALALPRHHPGMGRRVGNGLRELVVSRGRSGYLALYEHDELADAVQILAIRHQRESGYARG